MTEEAKKPKLGIVGDQPGTSPTETLPTDTATPTPKDARDIESLWVDSGLGDALTETNLLSVPVDKPKDFFRVNFDPAYRRRAEMYIHKVDGEIDKSYYILGKRMKGRLEEARDCVIVTCIYRDGRVRLWPIPLPRNGEQDNKAWVTARAAARIAMEKWVKLIWSGGSYKTRDAQPNYAPDPDWAKIPPFNALVGTAFSPHGFMDGTDHPIYRDLLGAPRIEPDDEDGL